MRNYLFILSFITITIINGCTYTNLTENQIYKSKQNYKCDIIIETAYCQKYKKLNQTYNKSLV